MRAGRKGNRLEVSLLIDVLCLRPEADFLAVGVTPPTELAIAYRDPADDDVSALLASARALVLPSAGQALNEEWFASVPNLQLIQFTGAGWDRISQATLRQAGCYVANVPGVNAIDVAEYVLLTAGMLLRNIKLGDALIRQGRYVEARRELAAENVRGFRGITVGVVGLGHIGYTVGKVLHSLGASVMFYDPQPRYADEAAALGFAQTSLEDLLRHADVITLHVPLLPQTRGLIGRAQLEWVKPDAVIVHASRGGVVDEAALLERLTAGAIRAVALDVYTSEPLPSDSSILEAAKSLEGRLLLTPHIAGVTRQAAAALYATAWENVARVLLEEATPLHQVI